MAFQGFNDFAPLRRPQTMNLGLNEYGMEEEDPFANRSQPTFQGSGPMNPTQNTDYSIQNIPTQNSVFESQSGPNKIHPATNDAYNRIKSLFDTYSPETQATNRYNDLLNNVPQLNEPGFLRRLAGAGAALGNVDEHFRRTGGGQDAADRVKYAPYLAEMAQWKEKTGPFLSAATNENQRNIQERTLVGNMMTAANADERNRITQENNDEKNRIAQQKQTDANKVAIFREQTRRIVAENPDWKPDYSGVKVKMINTKTGEMRLTTMDTDKLSEEDRLDMEGANRVKAAIAGGQGSIVVGNVVHVPDPNNPGHYIPASGLPSGTPTRLGTPSQGAGAKPNSLEANRERQDRMREVFERNGNEESVTQFLTFDSARNRYNLAPRPKLGDKKTWGFFGGVTQKDIDVWDLLKLEIDPDYVLPAGSEGSTYTTPPSGSETTPQPTRRPSVTMAPPKGPPKRDSTSNLWGPAPPVQEQPIGPQPGMEFYSSPQYVQNQINQATEQLNDPNYQGDKRLLFQKINRLNMQLGAAQRQTEASKVYETRTDPNNPNIKMRSSDGGKTADYSYDGGVKWGPKR